MTARTFSLTVTPVQSATITWIAPTTNTAGQTFDGSTPDRTLSGYRIYYGTSQAQVLAGTSTSVSGVTSPHTITGLTAGTWYFRPVSYDADGDESNTGDSATTFTKVIA